MQNLDELSLEEYLNKLGFDEETNEMIMSYSVNDIDKEVLHEKIKYLISLGLDPRRIRIVIEEDMTFVTEEIAIIVKNGEFLKGYLNPEELLDTLEVTPELLTVKEGYIEENIRLLNLIVTDKEVLKMLILDRGELLTFKPKYLSEKLSYLIENGLKDKLIKILIEEIEIFDLDNDEIDLDYLRKI